MRFLRCALELYAWVGLGLACCALTLGVIVLGIKAGQVVGLSVPVAETIGYLALAGLVFLAGRTFGREAVGDWLSRTGLGLGVCAGAGLLAVVDNPMRGLEVLALVAGILGAGLVGQTLAARPTSASRPTRRRAVG